MKKLNLFLAMAVGSSIACSAGPVTPRVSVMDVTDENTGAMTQSLLKNEFVYADGGELREVITSADGTTQQILRFNYDGGRVVRSELYTVDAMGMETLIETWDLEYDEDRITRFVTTDVVNDNATQTFEQAYDDDKRLVRRVLLDGDDEDTQNDRTDEYRYDEDGRLERRTQADGTNTAITDFAYEDENSDRLRQVIEKRDGQDDVTTGFQYDDDGALSRVNIGGGGSHELSYRDGRLDEIIRRSTNRKETVVYNYADGDLEGLIVNPEILYGSWFDLAGDLIAGDALGRLRLFDVFSE